MYRPAATPAPQVAFEPIAHAGETRFCEDGPCKYAHRPREGVARGVGFTPARIASVDADEVKTPFESIAVRGPTTVEIDHGGAVEMRSRPAATSQAKAKGR